jgi:hypothetical protein
VKIRESGEKEAEKEHDRCQEKIMSLEVELHEATCLCKRHSDGRCMLEVELNEATCLCKRHSDGRCMLEVELNEATCLCKRQ